MAPKNSVDAALFKKAAEQMNKQFSKERKEKGQYESNLAERYATLKGLEPPKSVKEKIEAMKERQEKIREVNVNNLQTRSQKEIKQFFTDFSRQKEKDIVARVKREKEKLREEAIKKEARKRLGLDKDEKPTKKKVSFKLPPKSEPKTKTRSQLKYRKRMFPLSTDKKEKKITKTIKESTKSKQPSKSKEPKKTNYLKKMLSYVDVPKAIKMIPELFLESSKPKQKTQNKSKLKKMFPPSQKVKKITTKSSESIEDAMKRLIK
jgi:hypothetical protein